MATRPLVRSPAPPPARYAPGAVAPTPACLNCGAALTGAYCAACGQRAVDPAAPTWHVLREALADATDLDGRVLRTLRTAASPGRLTVEFLRGRRAPYLGPVRLFLLAGAALSTTWLLTRGADARFYGYPPDTSAGAYIDTVVRGSLAASLAVAVTTWALAGGRRRLLDEAVFALHAVATLSLWAAAVIWLGTAWKVAWGTAARVPPSVPSLPYLLFLPAAAVGLAYLAGALRRAYGGPWWAAAARAAVLGAVGLAAVYGALYAGLLLARRPT